jgi:hypothetical protein
MNDGNQSVGREGKGVMEEEGSWEKKYHKAKEELKAYKERLD